MSTFMTFGFLIGLGMWSRLSALFDLAVGAIVVHALAKRFIGENAALKARFVFVMLYALAKFSVSIATESVPGSVFRGMLLLEWASILIAIVLHSGIAAGLARLVFRVEWQLAVKFGIAYALALAAVLAVVTTIALLFT